MRFGVAHVLYCFGWGRALLIEVANAGEWVPLGVELSSRHLYDTEGPLGLAGALE